MHDLSNGVRIQLVRYTCSLILLLCVLFCAAFVLFGCFGFSMVPTGMQRRFGALYCIRIVVVFVLVFVIVLCHFPDRW